MTARQDRGATAPKWRGTGASSKKTPAESRAEIEALLTRFGATGFGYADEGSRGTLLFKVGERAIRFSVPLPDAAEERFARGGASHEKAVRQRWRALVLVVRAKLESIAAEIATFDDAFLADIVLPNGETVAEWSASRVVEAFGPAVAPLALAAPRRPAPPPPSGRGPTLRLAAPRPEQKHVKLPIVEIEDITAPTDVFSCWVLGAKLSAGSCLAQQADSSPRARGVCVGCPEGAKVAQRLRLSAPAEAVSA